MSFFEVKELSFRYSGARENVIDQFSLSMQQGEIAGVVGASGSGKSTLLRLIAGLEVPRAGRISIDKHVVVDEHTFLAPEIRGVGMVFQDYALFPHLTVAQNVEFGLHRLKRAERKARLAEMLKLVQLEGFAKRYPHELSGGQQQRVALARALAPRPAILLMDEPFSNLDAELKVDIRKQLVHILQEAQMTCIIVTHDKDDVHAICNRKIEMGCDCDLENCPIKQLK